MFSLTGPPSPAGWGPQSRQQRSILKCRTQALRWRRYARKGGAGETGGAENLASPPPLLQQPLSLPPDDPTLQSFAAAYGADPLSPPPVIAAIARAAAAERAAAAAPDDGATRWAGAGERYQLRLGTAVALQGILGGGGALSLGRRRPPPPRDRAIKVVASVCDDVTGAILESREFAALQEALMHAAAAVAADSNSNSSSSTAFDAWTASMTTVYVPCLGSLEARRSYLEEYAQQRLQAFRGADGAAFDVDITRGWAAARALWQFALARALVVLLGGPGGGAQVLVSDPALTAFDRRVLSACGARVLPPNSHPIAGDDGGVLVFAPNCPHRVNADILRASEEAGGLDALAYIGTCCEYYDELEGLRERQQQQQQPTAAAAPPPFVEDDGGGGCCGCGSGGSGGGDGENALGWLASLRRDGRAVELALPSFGLLCDPATRLHVFPRGRGAAE